MSRDRSEVRAVQLKVKQLEKSGVPPMPVAYQTEGSAGLDLAAAISEPLEINPGEVILIPTGIAVELPGPEFVGLVFARSGLSTREQLGLANGVGVIDSDYRGEIHAPLYNFGKQPRRIEPGQRVAQLVVMPICRVEVAYVSELGESRRGEGGFGSTGRLIEPEGNVR
ncbi:dUTP diphosphatase [Kyrpidia spormannii]|uniref:dUTP diphosphatase n=1 Tax=Kyrpidia spormannii TaxID=2055160 RepID=UPI001E2C6E1B|nr:dUTP diphosphatase [Kyrpidia spormannii]